MIKVLNPDWSIFDIIFDYNFIELKYNNINQISLSWNPDKYIWKNFYIYDWETLLSSWICEKYNFSKNTNNWSVYLYPLFYDLRKDFYDDWAWNYVVYKNDTFENILTDLIDQYSVKVDNPILYLKTPLANSWNTGITIKYTFNYKTFLEAFNILFYTFLPMEKSVYFHYDWGIEIINEPTEIKATFWDDIKKINYNKKTDEIINYIIFDNKLSWTDHILKIYEDTTSTSLYWKRVKYWSDSRIKYEETADEKISSYFTKYAYPIIEIENIITNNQEVWLYNKLTINNWDKTFDDNIFVVWISFLKNWYKKIIVWTKLTRSTLSREDDMDSISESLDYIATMPDLPDYIKETYIDSTEIRSPNIAWNNGYFSSLMKVWSSWIEIDWVNKTISSSNFVTWTTWWNIDNDWSAEFNDVEIRWDMKAWTIDINDEFKVDSSWNVDIWAWSININDEFTVDSSWNVKWNDFINETTLYNKLWSTPTGADGKLWCEWNPTNKVLWWFFGWDTSNKQQVSMSRMQESYAFDLTTPSWAASIVNKISTRFQPRTIIFHWFYENTTDDIYWYTNWHAWSVSSRKWYCASLEFDITSWIYINTYTKTDRFWHWWGWVNWKVRAEVYELSSVIKWEDDWVTVYIHADYLRRIAWVITVLW